MPADVNKMVRRLIDGRIPTHGYKAFTAKVFWQCLGNILRRYLVGRLKLICLQIGHRPGSWERRKMSAALI